MKNHCFPAPAALIAACCGMMLILGSCRKGATVEVEQEVPIAVVAPELLENGLKGLPGAIYRAEADSPIHWQPWTKVSLDRARDAQRLVFCVIAMPQQPGFQHTLDALESKPEIVTSLNENYVPVLIDGDASREMGLLTADLCAEIKRSLQLPLFLWMTHEANPVAWIPAAAPDATAVVELFNQSDSMVREMWHDDPGYVLENSTMDNLNRRKRIEQRKIAKVVSEDPAVDVVRSIRQLASLYDPYSRSFDEAGGLFPSSSLELLATAAVHPGLPADVRTRCMTMTHDLTTDLMGSPMFDPLDDGVFLSRRGVGWSLPSFVRDCPGQARVAAALIQVYRATGDRRALEKALGLIAFAEKSYLTPQGLFAVGMTDEIDPEKWMWSVEDIKKELPEEDVAWWIKATGMKGLGNLPSEMDPQREYFRSNTISLGQSVEELAAIESQSVEDFRPRFEAVKAKLLKVRNKRLGEVQRDDSPHAAASLRMVSAYAAAFGATGNEDYRDKAARLLTRFRENFSVGQHLRSFDQEAAPSVGAGRAFLYALALQAVLDVAVITSDEQWLLWSEELSTTAAETFTGDGLLKECPDDARIIDLPITDLLMLFDDSTAGLVSAAESRLSEIGRPLVASFSDLAIPMPLYTLDRPILHTDLLIATLARHYKLLVLVGEDVSPEMREAVERLQMRVIQRRAARPDEEVPAGAVKVILPGGESRIANNPEALQEAVLPSSSK